MMSSTSSCMDGYGNFTMHQQQVSSNFYNNNNQNNHQQQQRQSGSSSSSYGYPGAPQDWAGAPLIKSSAETRHKKLYGSRSNGYEYEQQESSMSRLAKHTHGAPIIMPSRYRSKSSAKPMQSSFGHDSKNLHRTTQSNNGSTKAAVLQSSSSSTTMVEEINNYDDSGYHANGTCLPRIIKPRKRRKKDRKPIPNASMENNPPNPFTFTSNNTNQSSGFMQSMSANNNSAFQSQMNENFRHPAPPNDSNLFFNCDFDSNIVLNLPSSTSSSPISLSSSSLSSSTNTSSCSCRLCDPNCKIWAFPLRRSFSDNSAELDHHNNNSTSNNPTDGSHFETRKKDVGVIGGNRVKNEWNSGGESTLSILDMLEFNDFKNQQRPLTDVNRLRSESSSDSGDSGCDLLLGGLNIITDDILSSTIKNVGGLNAITKHLSEFSLMASNNRNHHHDHHSKEIIFDDANLSRLDVNEGTESRVCIDNLPTTTTFSYGTITKSLSSCEFGDHRNNLDNFLALELAASVSNCNYDHLMSPMLVNKQNNFSNNLDLNNNHHLGSAPTDGGIDCLNERTNSTFFDCFDDVTWKGS